MKNTILLLAMYVVMPGVYAAADDKQQTLEANKSQPVITKKKVIPKSATVSLESAYKREFAFLTAQRKELQQRLVSYKRKAAQDERKLENKIGALEQSTVNNSSLIDSLDDQLSDAERTEAAMGERSEVLDMTYKQAETTLVDYGINLKDSDAFQQSNEVKLSQMFEIALNLLNQLGIQRSGQGQFYLRDGKEVNGEIIRFGNVAAYGVSEQGSGALAPAGGKKYKLWKQSSEDIARSLSANEQPDTLKIFLYESLDKVIEEKAEKTWLGIIQSGGVIGWVIVVLGVMGAVFVVIRGFLLFVNSRDTKAKTEEVTEYIDRKDLKGARDFCSNESCAITRVMASTLKHLKDDRDHMEDIIVEAILNEAGAINRFGSTILVIASVAPLLGLLGTVTGMISTFDIITEFGTGDPKLLSSGISVALVTTQLGLIVAIPTLLCGSLLTAWATNIKRDMEQSALMITNAVLGDSSQTSKEKNGNDKPTVFPDLDYQPA